MNMKDVMDEDIDLDKLDQLAKTNGNIKFKQLSIIQNDLRRCGNFFSFVNEAKITSIADRLQQKGIGARAVKLAVDKIIDNYEKFPSFKVIIELCRSVSPKGSSATPCTKCNSSGLISIYEKSTGRNYAVSCDCPNGSDYPAFTNVRDINLNKFTRHAPLQLGDDVDPYEGFKEAQAAFLKKIKRIT